MNNILSFEDLWEKSEDMASKIHKTSTLTDIINQISNLLNNYDKICSSDISQEVMSSLKKRYVGEILFLISAISHKDNINIYEVLQEELSMNDLA
jgi:hypothetical protein